MKHNFEDIRAAFGELIDQRARPSVSIYAPLGVAGPERDQNAIRMKNLLKQAQTMLEPAEAERLAKVVEPHTVPEFAKRKPSPGLVIFYSPERAASYELPFRVDPLVVVEDRFHLKPLLPAISGLGAFYVLGLSQQQVRLLRGERWGVRRVPIDDKQLPFPKPSVGEKQLQLHSGAGGSAIFHGQGQGEHRQEEDVRRYLTAVDGALNGLLKQPRNALLILAGVDELVAEFRELTRHPNLASEPISGNVDNLSDQELHQRALPIAERWLSDKQRQVCQRAKDLAHTEHAALDLTAAALAASDGRIDKLFIRRGVTVWGRLDHATRRVVREDSQTPSNEDLLDMIAVQTFDKGGEVYVVDAPEMPVAEAPVFALLRY